MIRENKDLNIPSQKQMLAIYRCDEISAEVSKNFQAGIVPFKKVRHASPTHTYSQPMHNLPSSTVNTCIIHLTHTHTLTHCNLPHTRTQALDSGEMVDDFGKKASKLVSQALGACVCMFALVCAGVCLCTHVCMCVLVCM